MRRPTTFKATLWTIDAIIAWILANIYLSYTLSSNKSFYLFSSISGIYIAGAISIYALHLWFNMKMKSKALCMCLASLAIGIGWVIFTAIFSDMLGLVIIVVYFFPEYLIVSLISFIVWLVKIIHNRIDERNMFKGVH